MDRFRTVVEFLPSQEQISYRDKIIFLGSCFADTIGNKLQADLFDGRINPFGVLYNPVSVAQSIQLALGKRALNKDQLLKHNNLYHSPFHAGLFSRTHADELLNEAKQTNRIFLDYLTQSHFLFITFGTAKVYRHNKTGTIVANCHKIPAAEFEHTLLPVNDIVAIYRELLTELHAINPALQVVYTVSPVRHWKDGAHQNQISKSILHLAIEEIISSFGFCSYFPSYEIILDELRDYRFYAEDMLHINEPAAKYIYEKFRWSYFDSETKEIHRRIQKLKSLLNHRVLHKGTREHKTHVENKLKQAMALQTAYPFINFEKIILDIQEELKTL